MGHEEGERENGKREGGGGEKGSVRGNVEFEAFEGLT
jgi:hypothetical protein